MNSKYIITSVCLSLGVLSSCASYKASSLSNLSSEVVITSLNKEEEVLVVARAFDRDDCKKYLDRDVIAVGYQPVQIYIQNNSEKNYSFSLDRVSLSCARSEAVAETVHTSTVGRAAGYGVASLVLWPLAIPAVVDGVKSSKANASLDRDFSAKTAKDQTIQKYSNFNKLLFIPVEEYKDDFSITLIDQESGKQKILDVLAD